MEELIRKLRQKLDDKSFHKESKRVADVWEILNYAETQAVINGFIAEGFSKWEAHDLVMRTIFGGGA
jgi:hypothetical protein